MVIYLTVQRAILFLILILLVSCGSLFYKLGSLPLSGADEPRYARIAEEMSDRGSWITPLLQGKPWMEKPPLYYWITAPFYSVFDFKETAARIGPALCALVTGIAIYSLGSILWSRQAGLAGALVLLTSLGFVGFGRSASTDMPFTCFLTLSMAIWGAAVKKDLGWKVLWAYLFLGVAVLGKGPVAVVLAAGIGLCFWYIDERGVIFHNWRVVPGIAVTAFISIPWFYLAFRENGFSFISTFFVNHNIARYLTGIHHHSQPTLYYLPVLIALLFPWSGLLPLLFSGSLIHGLKNWRRWNPAMVFLACWFLVPVVFFSISDSKLAGYVLPSLPPMALIFGVSASRAMEGSVGKLRVRAAAALLILLSLAMAIAAPIFFQKEYGGNLKTGLLLSAAIFLPALVSFVFAIRGQFNRAFRTTVVQGLLTVIVLAQFAFPVLADYHSTKTIARRAMEVRRSGEPIVTYRFFHHSLHYYTGYQIAGKLDDEAALVRFVREHPGALVVTSIQGMGNITGIKGLVCTCLGEQGTFRLVRVKIRD